MEKNNLLYLILASSLLLRCVMSKNFGSLNPKPLDAILFRGKKPLKINSECYITYLIRIIKFSYNIYLSLDRDTCEAKIQDVCIKLKPVCYDHVCVTPQEICAVADCSHPKAKTLCPDKCGQGNL